MGLILAIALVTSIVAMVQAQKKLHTFLFILGWTLAVPTALGLITFLFALAIHAGNPPALAGDIAGATLTLTLVVSSLNCIRANKLAFRRDLAVQILGNNKNPQVLSIEQYCTGCGSSILHHSQFCVGCGRPVISPSPSEWSPPKKADYL
jgi:hypothetical protein